MTFCSPESLSLIYALEGFGLNLFCSCSTLTTSNLFSKCIAHCVNNWELKVLKSCIGHLIEGSLAPLLLRHHHMTNSRQTIEAVNDTIILSFSFHCFWNSFTLVFGQFPPPHSRQPVSAAIEIQFTEVTKPALGKSQLVKLPHQCHRRPHLIDGQSCQQSFFWLD